MDDAMPTIVDRNIGNSEVRRIRPQARNLLRRLPVGKWLLAESCRHRVIGDRDMSFWTAQFVATFDQASEGLRAGDLLNEMPIDVEQHITSS